MRVVLTVVNGPHEGREFAFDEHDHFIVGRARFARFQLSLKDGYISRVHFLVEVNPPCCRLTDMGSTNGTLVNDQVVQSVDLHDGDRIEIGDRTVIRVSIRDVPVSRAAAVPGMCQDHRSAGPPLPPPMPQRAFPGPGAVGGSSSEAPTTVFDASEETGSFHPAERGPSSGLMEHVNSPATAGPFEPAINGFRLIRELGRGGMGIVYLAERIRDGELLALKTIKPAVSGSFVQVERFLREARILEQLDHRHIVAFREVGESSGVFYFAMDFVRGIDASNLQNAHGGPLPLPRALDLACQMLDALAYAHGRGIVHRDIKPANLLVENQGGREIARLSDFGLARTYQASQMSGLTLKGDVGGTMAYMAPEQITAFREVRPPSDQYSAAATLYRFLTNRHIYELPRHTAKQILMILQDPPVPIEQRRPDLPVGLAAVIRRALAREPNDRFPDVTALRRALEPFR